jgi:acetylglutamate kinase
MESVIKKADVLIEALPYIQQFKDKTVVIKYGGAAMENEEMREGTLEDIVFMNFVGIKPVLVHGGGPFINKNMHKAGITPNFIDGHRVTDEKAIKIVEKTLADLNKTIIKEIKSLGAKAESFGGGGCDLIKIKEPSKSRMKTWGFVGEIESINITEIKKALKTGKIPVVYPVAANEHKKLFNINADVASSKIAAALKAQKLVLLTNTNGIMMDQADTDSMMSTLHAKEVADLIERKVIQGGMLPKVNACIEALKGEVNKAHIIDGRIPHSLLLEIFTDKGIGTEIIHG